MLRPIIHALLATSTIFLATMSSASPVYYTDTYTAPEVSSLVVGLEFITQLPTSDYGSAFANGVSVINGSNDFVAIDRAGLVYKVDETGNKTVILDVGEEIGSAYINNGGQKGLQYAVVNPGFTDPGSDGYMKLYTTTTESSVPETSFTLFTLPDDPALSVEHYDVVSEWDLSGTEPLRSVLMAAESPYGDHNVRWLGFDDEENLYITFGDGGNTYWRDGDTVAEHGFGQNTLSPLGSILRISLDGEGGYTIPDDNPYVEDTEYLPELYATGFRNPQDCWFTDTGQLYCGDIGQRSAEEINVIEAGNNYGWNVREGNYCVISDDQDFVEDCGTDLIYTDPLFAYSHLNNLAGLENRAIGGVAVCENCGIAALEGFILAVDLAAGTLFSYDPDTDSLFETMFKDMTSGVIGSYADIANLSRVEARLGGCGDFICFSSRRDDIIYRLVDARVTAPFTGLLLCIGLLLTVKRRIRRR